MIKKLKDNGVFCCKGLAKLFAEPAKPIKYYSDCRMFLLYDCQIDYCPMCGTLFPPDLSDFCDEVQSTEFGITLENYTEMKDKGLIPKEFDTDEWWKKRQHYPNFPEQTLSAEARLKKRVMFRFEDESPEAIEERWQEHLAWENSLEPKKGILCCVGLWLDIYTYPEEPDRPLYYTRALITYEPEKRRCMLKNMTNLDEFRFKRNQPKIRLRYMFFYCVRCGSPLPKSLAKEWFEIVTKQFGVKDVFNRKELEQKLPPKYLSEEWWREAGL